MKFKTVKLLEQNKRENIYDLGLGRDFLFTTKENTIHKKKIGKWKVLKIKKFGSLKNSYKNENISHCLLEITWKLHI